MHIALGHQLERNAEAYVNDLVVKSWEARTLIEDLEEPFASLRKVDMWLNLVTNDTITRIATSIINGSSLRY